MPLTVTRRKSSGALTISGTVAGQRVRRRAQSDHPKLAAKRQPPLRPKFCERNGTANVVVLDRLPKRP
jgi:hypothetical protein